MARLVGGVDLQAHSPQDAITRDAGRLIFDVHGTGDGRVNSHHSHAILQLPDEYEPRLAAFFHTVLDQ